jgi:pimeloyl-ACP methyl ester carboxylesterase
LDAEVSLFKSAEAEVSYRAAYDASLQLWPVQRESIYIPTKFGLTHVLACGPVNGEPVLLLPAMACTATMWYATVPALSTEFRCYAVDFPSDMGLSALDNPPANRMDCVAWLRELLDGLGIVKASFVGASYGSFLALNYAIAEPARVKKIALSSPAAGIVRLGMLFYARVFLSFLLPGRSAGDRIMARLFDGRFPLDNPVIRQLLVGIKTLKPHIKVYPMVFTDSELAGIPAPLYLILGEKEVCYNPWSAAKRLQRVMPTASVEIVPGAGHLLVMERPDFVNQRLLAFLLD